MFFGNDHPSFSVTEKIICFDRQGEILIIFKKGPLGKPHVRIFSVQPEFCRKGGGLNCLAKWVVAVL